MLTIKGHLVHMLERVARALGDDLRDKLVFVGGCTTALFITDEVTLDDVRLTDDVDLIVDLAGYSDWARMQQVLQDRGFTYSPTDDVICRMRLGDLKVDFMPDDAAILGFSNRWYAAGIKTAMTHRLAPDLEIKCLTPPLFVATKLEAYLGRGDGDLLMSRDAEDILLIVDGRPDLLHEIQESDPEVCSFIAVHFRSLLGDPYFESFLHGNVRGPEGRIDIVRDRFERIARAGSETAQ